MTQLIEAVHFIGSFGNSGIGKSLSIVFAICYLFLMYRIREGKASNKISNWKVDCILLLGAYVYFLISETNYLFRIFLSNESEISLKIFGRYLTVILAIVYAAKMVLILEINASRVGISISATLCLVLGLLIVVPGYYGGIGAGNESQFILREFISDLLREAYQKLIAFIQYMSVSLALAALMFLPNILLNWLKIRNTQSDKW